MRFKGWLSQFASSVLIARETVPDAILTPQLALTINTRVLDGNHRVVVFKKLFGDISKLEARVKCDFANAPDEKLIADSESDVKYVLRTMHLLLHLTNHCTAVALGKCMLGCVEITVVPFVVVLLLLTISPM